MSDVIQETIEILETAFAEKDWERILDAIRLLNEIPDRDLPNEEDDNMCPNNYF